MPRRRSINKKAGIVILAVFLLFLPMHALAWDLTGVWNCNDGGTYYFQQKDTVLWWLGEFQPTNPIWCNVAKGTIDSNTITLDWSDVPKGNARNSGTLVLNIISNNELRKAGSNGADFGGSSWTR